MQSTPLITSFNTFKQALLKQRLWSEEELSPPPLDKLVWTSLAVDKKQLSRAITLIANAKKNHSRVLIFGDYDVDGQTATSIMWLGLRHFGIIAEPFIPDRLRHGYGMSTKALAEIFAKSKPSLIITVDNGISAHQALAFCQQNQVKVIVTDHHQLGQQPPLAEAVIHDTSFSGALLSWYLIWQLLAQTKAEQAMAVASNLLDLACLGTIVDQVPQRGLCRQLCRLGLLQLRTSKRPGLIALANHAQLNLSLTTGRDLGFLLGPRINAIGRLTGGLDALRLLCSQSTRYTYLLAAKLNSLNQQRQELTAAMWETAAAQVDETALPALIIVADNSFHEGIIGLLASKFTDKFARPAIVIAKGEEIAKASCRSTGEFDITAFLAGFSSQLCSFGGHCLAAGFSAKTDKLPALIKQMQKQALKHWGEIVAVKKTTGLPVSCSLLANPHLLPLLDLFEPLGAGNEDITIAVNGRVSEIVLVGKAQNHAHLKLSDANHSLVVMWWNFASAGISLPRQGNEITVTATLKTNYFAGKKSLNLIGKSWR